MGIIANGDGSVTVRRAGVSHIVRPTDFVSADTDAELEARLSTFVKSALNCEVGLHIFSRTPLKFVIYTAPLGFPRSADWWNWTVRL